MNKRLTGNLFMVFSIFALIFCQLIFLSSYVSADTASSEAKAIKIVKVKYTLNEGTFYVPEVYGINNKNFKKIQDSFNKQLKDEIFALTNDEESSLNGSFTITFCNSDIIAFRFTGDSYTPGTAHPNKLDIVFHHDLNSGKLYKLEDLFNSNVNFTEKIKNIAAQNSKAYKSKSSDLFKDWNYMNFADAWDGEERYFRITNNRDINAYFFLSYATGYASGYDIPFSSMKDIINTESPFVKKILRSKPINLSKVDYNKPIIIKLSVSDRDKLGKVPSDTIKAIQTKDFKKLSQMVHPKKGLIVSIAPFIEKKYYASFTGKSLLDYSTGKNKKTLVTWGIGDGTGEPVKLTFDNFHKEFIGNVDYLKADTEVVYSDIPVRSNLAQNYKEKFPGAMFVEYHFKGTEEFTGMDWKSIILIYEELNGKIYLSGIVLDFWRI